MTLLFPLAGLIVGLAIGGWRALAVTAAAEAVLILILVLGTDAIEDAEDVGYATVLAVLPIAGAVMGVAIRGAPRRGRNSRPEAGP